VLVVTRYTVPVEEAEVFREKGRTALAALTARPGCRGGSLGRNVDEPTLWVLATTWENVGAYRRALSAYEVKLHAVPVMYRALDEPTAFEYLATAEPGGLLHDHQPSRAADADLAGPGRPGGPRTVPSAE
jgi:hypothetical protein